MRKRDHQEKNDMPFCNPLGEIVSVVPDCVFTSAFYTDAQYDGGNRLSVVSYIADHRRSNKRMYHERCYMLPLKEIVVAFTKQ